MPSITNTDLEAPTIEISSGENDLERQLIPSQELSVLSNTSALDEVINFHLSGEGRTRLSEELAIQFTLSLVASLGAMLYGPPASNFAYSECTESGLRCNFFLFSYVAGTCVTSAVVLHNSTIEFLARQKAEHIPAKLAEYLQDPLTSKQRILKNIGITVGSFISSIPFVIINLVNPIPGLPKIFIVPLAGVIAFTNTLLHLLPFELVSQIPFYRAPILPFEWSIRQLVNSRLTEEQKQEKRNQAKIDECYQTIKQRLISHLDQGKKLLSIYGFKFEGCGYTNDVATRIRELRELEQTSVELLQKLLNNPRFILPSKSISQPGRINKFFRTIAYPPGALLVMSSCAGFLASPVNELTKLTDNEELGVTLAAPSVYFLGVLLAFFGGTSLQRTYDYFTAWKGDAVKIPLEFKLYPKTAVLLIMISLYLSAFSYAAGAQLINDNFTGNLEFLRPHLLELAETGLPFLGFTAMLNFFINILRNFGQYAGADDTKRVIDLQEAFTQIQNSVQRMKPINFLDSLVKMDVNAKELETYLKVHKNEDKQECIKTFSCLKTALKAKIDAALKAEKINSEYQCKLMDSLVILQDNSNSLEETENFLSNFQPELPLSLKEVCKEYTYVNKILLRLEKMNFVNETELDDLNPQYSLNNDATTSTERTPLLPGGGTVHARFYHPPIPRQYLSDNRGSVSPEVTSSSNYRV